MSKLRLAAGYVKSAADLDTGFGKDILRSPLHAVTVGSITVPMRPGNPEPHYEYNESSKTSYNAVGLKNPGWRAFCPHELAQIAERVVAAEKHLVLSLAPLQPGDLTNMLREAMRMPYRTWLYRVQLNGGCPNVSGHNIIAYDADAIEAMFQEAYPFTALVEFEFKTSPLLPPAIIDRTIALCATYGIKWIVSANTQRVKTPTHHDTGKPYTGSEYCGMAGAPLFARNIDQLQAFQKAIERSRNDIRLVACGGVSTAAQVAACEEAGAQEIEMMTAILEEGPRLVQDILMETV